MRRLMLLASLLLVLLLAGCGSSSSSSSSSSASSGSSSSVAPGSLGPEGVVLESGSVLAPASSTAQGKPVSGIQCGGTEQFVKHVHAHLAVYVNGQSRQIPAGVGLIAPAQVPGSGGAFYTATRCFYWLHTHAADGIIHIESPSARRVFTLGDFFAEWQQPLSSKQVGPATGTVTAYLNGRRWSQDPRTIPLDAHNAIQLDVGTPVQFNKVSFGNQSL